jgi:RNA polymerase sigma-70 factor, ECF subfamily
MSSSVARSSSEPELLALCKSGSFEHFPLLVRPYIQSVKLISYSILKNSHDVEDVVQETILKAYQHLDQLRDGDSFKAWLLRIAGNEARMRKRKDRQHLYSSVEQDIEVKPFQPKQFVEWRKIPSEELQREELRTALTAALACLEDGYREVFVLRDVQHLSSAEAGKILGISEGAVNTRLHRARLQMREYLNPLFQVHTPMSPMMPLKMMLLMGKTLMRKAISCRHVTSQISGYVDSTLTADMIKKIEDHLKLCGRCSIVVDTVRKLLYLSGDENVFMVPFECRVDWEDIERRLTKNAQS